MEEPGKDTDTNTFLSIKDLSKRYPDSDQLILNDISLSLNKGSRIGIVGETGSGKSTLLKCIAGLEHLSEGQVSFEGEQLEDPNEQLVVGHKHIAYLKQGYSLPKFQTVENFLFDPYENSEHDAHLIYEACNIEKLLSKDTQQISGGEKQRVALAKLLMGKPRLLLLDEPFSNLDPHNKSSLKRTLLEIEKKLGTSIIMVTHDAKDILPWADNIIVLKSGVVVQQETPKNIYEKPINEYVAGLFGSYNIVPPTLFDELKSTHKNKNEFEIIRPEQFDLGPENEYHYQGVVKGIDFMGNYYLVSVEYEGTEIVIQTTISEYLEGRKVSFRFAEGR